VASVDTLATRDLGAWMDAVDKVVFSTTLTSTEWENSRLAPQPLETEVKALKDTQGPAWAVVGTTQRWHE
jgi:hypothetical protein